MKKTALSISLFLLFAFASLTGQGATMNFGGIELTLEQAIDYVLQNNLTLKSAKYDVVMSDTEVARAEKKYAPLLSLDSQYTNTSPLQNIQNFARTKTQENLDVTLSVQKLFSTGTMVSAGVRENWFKLEVAPGGFFTPDPPLHRPSLFVTFQQELLKNSFGYNDRRQLEIAENAYKRQRAATIDLLSGLVVQALVDYWTVTIETSALENAKTEAEMTRTVRNIIARNIRIGLAENFDLNQYNSLLANAEAKVAATEQNLKVAVRKLLRTVNMPAETQVEGITNLIDTLPDLNAEEALQAAFEKRVDYKNAKLELESLEMQSELAANNALPSITANASLTTQGQNTQLLPALQNSGSLDFPVWVVGLKMSYPLWDKEVKATQRNAEFNVTKAKIRMEELTQEIRDDVLNKMENVRLTHEVLMRTRESKEQAELYYNRLMARVRQGRFNSVNVKTSLDNLVANRQRELEALVQFNVSILQFDLAKNEIFERYNVDVEKYLAQVK